MPRLEMSYLLPFLSYSSLASISMSKDGTADSYIQFSVSSPSEVRQLHGVNGDLTDHSSVSVVRSSRPEKGGHESEDESYFVSVSPRGEVRQMHGVRPNLTHQSSSFVSLSSLEEAGHDSEVQGSHLRLCVFPDRGMGTGRVRSCGQRGAICVDGLVLHKDIERKHLEIECHI